MSGRRPLRVGTRGSTLALVQAEQVAARLRPVVDQVETVPIVTAGDRRAPGAPIGEGVFVGAIREALLAGVVDVAVHSAKDLPVAGDRGTVVLYTERADPRDALVMRAGGRRLDDLPSGASVGTDSPRRAGFLLALRPDLRVQPIQGNVPTRLRKLDAGEADALVLAVAGLQRLGLEDRLGEIFAARDVVPAPAQAAIAVEMRADDGETRARLQAIEDPRVRLAVESERRVLAGMGGGCRSPLGAFAQIADGTLRLVAGRPGRVMERTARANERDAAALVDDVVHQLQREPGGVR
jgi:hydroxymethylbilane synthase